MTKPVSIELRSLKAERDARRSEEGRLGRSAFTSASDVQVLMNGEPLLAVRRVNIDVRVGYIPVVTLELMVGDLKVDPLLIPEITSAEE